MKGGGKAQYSPIYLSLLKENRGIFFDSKGVRIRGGKESEDSDDDDSDDDENEDPGKKRKRKTYRHLVRKRAKPT